LEKGKKGKSIQIKRIKRPIKGSFCPKIIHPKKTTEVNIANAMVIKKSTFKYTVNEVYNVSINVSVHKKVPTRIPLYKRLLRKVLLM